MAQAPPDPAITGLHVSPDTIAKFRQYWQELSQGPPPGILPEDEAAAAAGGTAEAWSTLEEGENEGREIFNALEHVLQSKQASDEKVPIVVFPGGRIHAILERMLAATHVVTAEEEEEEKRATDSKTYNSTGRQLHQRGSREGLGGLPPAVVSYGGKSFLGASADPREAQVSGARGQRSSSPVGQARPQRLESSPESVHNRGERRGRYNRPWGARQDECRVRGGMFGRYISCLQPAFAAAQVIDPVRAAFWNYLPFAMTGGNHGYPADGQWW